MTATISEPGAVCGTCGQPADESTGLCLACLMGCASAAETLPPASEDEALRIGNYELLREIDRGGMGIIYEARQIHTGQHVALKLLQAGIANRPELVARFRREARAAATLDHPHVLPVYEVNEASDGVSFFTMKLATGGSLLRRRAEFTGRFREVAALVAKVARAVQHAHERGVLHRDLKPGNILFDGHGEPMVSDFGLAAWLHEESDLTRTIMVFGTPGYLPPEYVNGRPEVLQPTSDIYSLGVILFELLAGRLPVPAEASLSAIRDAAEKPPPLLRAFAPGAGRDLEVICARCLEADPSLRYQSAAAVAEDLERWLRDEPIAARPTPGVVRAWKWARRHPAISIATAVCVALAGTGAVLTERLSSVTAYDRALVVLPIEDLDTLSRDSPAAREATRHCLAAVSNVSGLTSVVAETAPDPLPANAALVEFSERLRGRYLLSGSIWQSSGKPRLVIRLIDARANTLLKSVVLDWADPRAGSAAIEAAVAAMRKPAPTPPPSIPSDPAGEEDARRAAKYEAAGEQLIDTGTPENASRAITIFEEWTRQQPHNAKAKAKLASAIAYHGLVDDRLKALETATRIAREAVASAPHLSEARRSLAYVLLEGGYYTEATEHALEVFARDPGDASTARTVAAAMAAVGALDNSIIWNWKAALRGDTSGALELYRGLDFMAIGDFAASREAIAEFILLRPQLADGYQAMATLDFLEGKPTEALQAMRDLHARFPDHSVVTQNLACLLFLAGNSPAAEQLFRDHLHNEDAGMLAFLSVRRLSALGCLALERGEPTALPLIEQALTLDESRLGGERRSAGLLFEKAANLAMLGRKTEAFESLRKATECAYLTYHQMKLDRRVDSLRKEQAFDEILRLLERRFREMRERVQAVKSSTLK